MPHSVCPDLYSDNSLCNVQNFTYAHRDLLLPDDSLQFFIDFIGNEAYTDVSFYPAFRKVEDGPHFKISLADPECPFDYPKAMILVYNILCVEVGIGDIALQSVPSFVFGNPLTADGDLHVLAYLKELVVAPLIHLRLRQCPPCGAAPPRASMSLSPLSFLLSYAVPFVFSNESIHSLSDVLPVLILAPIIYL